MMISVRIPLQSDEYAKEFLKMVLFIRFRQIDELIMNEIGRWWKR